jgi:hypothetical protein
VSGDGEIAQLPGIRGPQVMAWTSRQGVRVSALQNGEHEIRSERRHVQLGETRALDRLIRPTTPVVPGVVQLGGSLALLLG